MPRPLSEFAARAFVALTFALCCALPLGWVVYALATTPDAFAALRPLDFHLALLARTLFYGLCVAAIAALLAAPVAIVLGGARAAVAAPLAALLPAALLLPSIVYAYGWMQVLRVAHVYPMPGGAADVARCVWTLATWLWPIPAGVVGLALRRLDGALQQQALLDGGYWRVVARQLARPAAAALAVVAILAVQEFAVYEPTGISVVATEVRTVFETGNVGANSQAIATVQSGTIFNYGHSTQQRNAAAAVVTALPLVLAIAAMSVVALRGRRGDDASDVLAVGPKPRVLRPRTFTLTLAGAVVALTLVLPIAAMALSVTRPFDPVRVWTTFAPPALGTLSIAAAAGVVAIGLAAAGLVTRLTWPAAVGLVAFLVGGQLLAIALIRLYNHPSLEWSQRLVYNGPGIVVIAYLARFAWLAAFASRSTWNTRAWRAVRDMAAVDGATAGQTARHVVWPLAWPLVFAAGLLTMLLAMTEVPATVLLNPVRPPVMTPQLMTWVHTLRSDDMLEGSLLLASLVAVLSFVATALLFLMRRASLPFGKLRAGRVAAKRASVVLLALVLTGCSGEDKPDEVWLETGAGEGQCVYPRAIAYSKSDDSFYVIDRMARIQRLDKHGKFLAGWRMHEFANGKPVGLSVGPDGHLYVADTHYHRVVVFDKAGKELRAVGTEGKGPGQFIFPCDVAFDSQGRIFVAEFGDHDRVQIFDKDWNYVSEFGRFGNGDGEFSRPQSLAIAGDTVYVADACNHRIAVFTTAGKFLRNMGGVGSDLGQFRFPYGLDLDTKGRLVVTEFGNNRVQLIDPQTGKGLAKWGTGGRDAGQLAYPWAAAVDQRNRVVAVDAGNNRLQVFKF